MKIDSINSLLKTSNRLAFEVLLKINIQEKFQKIYSFCVIDKKKIPHVTFLKHFADAFIFHNKTHFL
jgi:hypothetical protein